MKKFMVLAALASSLVIMTGCEEDSDSDNNLIFENMSRRTVQVIPLTTEWGAFTIQPGEKNKLHNIRDVDYRLSPETRVQAGSASTDRYVIIVDAPPESK